MQWRTTQPFSPPSPSCCSLSRCVWSCSSPMQYRRIWRPHRRQISERPQLLGLLRAHVAQVGLSGCACLAASVCAQAGCIFHPVGSHQQWASHLKAPSSTGPTLHLTVCASGCWGPAHVMVKCEGCLAGVVQQPALWAGPVWVPAPWTWIGLDHIPLSTHTSSHMTPPQPCPAVTLSPHFHITTDHDGHPKPHQLCPLLPLLPLQAHPCHPPSPSLPDTPLKACMRCAACCMRKVVGGHELLRLFCLVPPQARGPPAAFKLRATGLVSS